MKNRKSEPKMDCNLLTSRWIFFFNAILFLLQVTLSKTVDPISWSKKNPDFHPNGLTIDAEIDDIVDIICPQADNTADAEYHSLVQVDYNGYKNCSLDSSERTRKLLDCNRPFERNLYTLLFQRFTPFPGRPYFQEGRDYYFITTSNGTRAGINNRHNGLCKEPHHMKMIVHIGPRPAVVFSGEIKLLSLSGVVLEWEDTLQDSSTERYNEVTVEVESALKELYGDAEGFVKAEVTGYRQGSVIVEFEIHFSEGSRVSIDTIQRPLEETAQPFGHIRVDPNSVYIQVSGRDTTTDRTTTKNTPSKSTTLETHHKSSTVRTSRMPPWKPITSNEILMPDDKDNGNIKGKHENMKGENSSSRSRLSLVTLFVSFLCAVVRWHH